MRRAGVDLACTIYWPRPVSSAKPSTLGHGLAIQSVPIQYTSSEAGAAPRDARANGDANGIKTPDVKLTGPGHGKLLNTALSL